MDKFLGLIHRQTKRRKQTDRIRSGYAREHFLLKEKFATHFLDRFLELDTDHQTTAPNFLDTRKFMKR